MGFRHTVREVMRVRMAKFAAIVLFATFMAAVFAPQHLMIPPNRSPGIPFRHRPANIGWEPIGLAVTS
jgi:hypothetical protein